VQFLFNLSFPVEAKKATGGFAKAARTVAGEYPAMPFPQAKSCEVH